MKRKGTAGDVGKQRRKAESKTIRIFFKKLCEEEEGERKEESGRRGWENESSG